MTLLWALLLGCTEYRVRADDPVPPADPPPDALDPAGEPPDDWGGCSAALLGRYHNLSASHPDVAADAPPAPADPDEVDWWSEQTLAFSRWDATLELGGDWWPVDTGQDGDPAHFAARWTGWLRVWEATELVVVLGAADDAWLRLGDEIVARNVDNEALSPEAFAVALRPGVLPVEISAAHRLAPVPGMRFRVAAGDVTLCGPDFPAE